jgi:hypothetical protein
LGCRAAAVGVLLPLGRGLLRHPANGELLRRLAHGPDPAGRYCRQLLLVLFRFLLARKCCDARAIFRECRRDCPDLADCHVEDADLPAPLGLDPHELGKLYQELLELHPLLDVTAQTFNLVEAAGHRRKTSGSYYTPPELVECLLSTALDPVADEATDAGALRICDPACGSGHFLAAAARHNSTATGSRSTP